MAYREKVKTEFSKLLPYLRNKLYKFNNYKFEI